jgi:hypothetical protein
MSPIEHGGTKVVSCDGLPEESVDDVLGALQVVRGDDQVRQRVRIR